MTSLPRDSRRYVVVVGSCIEYEHFPVIFLGKTGATLDWRDAEVFTSRGSAYKSAGMLYAHMLETGISHFPGMPVHDFYVSLHRLCDMP